MKKKKCNPTHCFYQELNLNYLMLKTNENIFKLLSLLIWRTEVYIRGLIRFSAFYKSRVSKSSNVFCFYYCYLRSNVFTNSTILLLYYCFCYDFVFENKWLIDWLIDIKVVLQKVLVKHLLGKNSSQCFFDRQNEVDTRNTRMTFCIV